MISIIRARLGVCPYHYHVIVFTCFVIMINFIRIIRIINITARPWGLPGLTTSVWASQDDDDDDDVDIFLKPKKKPKDCMENVPWGRGILISSWNPKRNPNDCMFNCSMWPQDLDICLKLIRNCKVNCSFGARGFWYLLETLQETLMIVWLIVPWGWGILISSWNRKRNPNDCMIDCSMGAGNFDVFLKPYKKPSWLYG